MSENPLNILTEIVAPDLTQETFASGLREAFENINDNFKKIIASPIYRGQRGESVKIKSVDILDTTEGVFTEVGQNIVKVIFDVDLSDWDGTYSSLTNKIKSMYGPVTAGGATAADYFKINNTILFFYMDNVEETLLCPAQVYMFQDCRTPELSTTVVKNYIDATCCISFTWENDTYEFIKSNEFPTISWSESIGDYVWNINGADTNITAKGLNGVDGTTVVPIFKSATKEGDYKIDSMFVASSSKWMTIEEVHNDRPEIWDTLLIGQTCVVYYCDGAGNVLSTETTSISSKISTGDGEVYAHRLNMNIATAELLHLQLAKIRKYTVEGITETTPSGIFIPAGVTTEDADSSHIVHMIYRDTVEPGTGLPDAHFALVKVNSAYQNPGKDTGLQANLCFDNYQKYIFNSGISITKDTISNDTINVIGTTNITGPTNITGTTKIAGYTSISVKNSSMIISSNGIETKAKQTEIQSNNTTFIVSDGTISSYATKIDINSSKGSSNDIYIGSTQFSTTYIKGTVAIGVEGKDSTSIFGKNIYIGKKTNSSKDTNTVNINGATVNINGYDYGKKTMILKPTEVAISNSNTFTIHAKQLGHLVEVYIHVHFSIHENDNNNGIYSYTVGNGQSISTIFAAIPGGNGIALSLVDASAKSKEAGIDFYLNKEGTVVIRYNKEGNGTLTRDYHGRKLYLANGIAEAE